MIWQGSHAVVWMYPLFSPNLDISVCLRVILVHWIYYEIIMYVLLPHIDDNTNHISLHNIHSCVPYTYLPKHKLI